MYWGDGYHASCRGLHSRAVSPFIRWLLGKLGRKGNGVWDIGCE